MPSTPTVNNTDSFWNKTIGDTFSDLFLPKRTYDGPLAKAIAELRKYSPERHLAKHLDWALKNGEKSIDLEKFGADAKAVNQLFEKHPEVLEALIQCKPETLVLPRETEKVPDWTSKLENLTDLYIPSFYGKEVDLKEIPYLRNFGIDTSHCEEPIKISAYEDQKHVVQMARTKQTHNVDPWSYRSSNSVPERASNRPSNLSQTSKDKLEKPEFTFVPRPDTTYSMKNHETWGPDMKKALSKDNLFRLSSTEASMNQVMLKATSENKSAAFNAISRNDHAFIGCYKEKLNALPLESADKSALYKAFKDEFDSLPEKVRKENPQTMAVKQFAQMISDLKNK